jgi:hypothetical protein
MSTIHVRMERTNRNAKSLKNPKKTQLGKEMNKKHLVNTLEKKGASWKTMKTRIQ